MIAAFLVMATLGLSPRAPQATPSADQGLQMITLVDTNKSPQDTAAGFIFSCIVAAAPNDAAHFISINEAENPHFKFPFVSRNVLIVHAPSAAEWKANRDSYVPHLDDLLSRMAVAAPKGQTYVVIPPYRMDMDKAWYEDEFVPLTKQAIRETGIKEIVSSPKESVLKIQIMAALADWKAITNGWKVVDCDSYQKDEGEPAHAIDGDPNTYWHTEYDPQTTKYPHFIEVDTGSTKIFNGFRYLPRRDGGTNGDVGLFNLEVSEDGQTWKTVLENQKVSGGLEAVFAFDNPIRARYFKFTALKEQENGPWAAASELELIP